MKIFTKAMSFFNGVRSDRGASAVEYALLVALIAVVIIIAVTLLGNNLSGIFTEVANTVD